MTRPTVVISVDCGCAMEGRCYIPEIVKVAEDAEIPLTWLLGVLEHDPMINVKLYHNEYLHRIPAWHEVGLHLTFDTGRSSSIERGDLIRVGKDILKQFSIKPTAFRAANGDIEPGDLAALEDIGIRVDATPGSSSAPPPHSPTSPYHPDPNHIHQKGNSKIWIAPVTNISGVSGYLNEGFDRLKGLVEAQLESSDYVGLAMRDTTSNGTTLSQLVAYLKGKSARFVTLTQLVSEQ